MFKKLICGGLLRGAASGAGAGALVGVAVFGWPAATSGLGAVIELVLLTAAFGLPVGLVAGGIAGAVLLVGRRRGEPLSVMAAVVAGFGAPFLVEGLLWSVDLALPLSTVVGVALPATLLSYWQVRALRR